MRISDWSSDVCSADLAAHPGLPGLLGLDHDIREDRVLPRGLVEDGAAEGEVARLCHALLQDRDQRDLGDPVPYLLELDREVDAEEVTGLFQRDAVLDRKSTRLNSSH